MLSRALMGIPNVLRSTGAAGSMIRRRPFPSHLTFVGGAEYHSSAPSHLPLPDDDGPKKKQAKVKKKEKKSASGKKKGARDDLVQLLARALDTVPEGPPPPSEEELERREKIAKAYTRGMFEFHNQINHDLACKIKLKRHAIKMLPREGTWKEEALKIDEDGEGIGPPYKRHIPTDYPPVKDFDPTPFILMEQEED